MHGKNEDKKTRRLVTAALFTAIITVTTLAVQIPTPATGGYVHIGDCFCLVAAWILPLPWAMAAAGVGTMLADLLGGYTVYAPASLLIKAGIALIARLLYLALSRGRRGRLLPCAVSGIAGEAWMICGYFLFNAWARGKGLAALASVPGNALQAGVGVVAATVLWLALGKVIGKSGSDRP